MRRRDEYHLLNEDFTQPHTLRTFWLFVGAVLVLALVAIGAYTYFNGDEPPQRLADLTDIDIGSPESQIITEVPSSTLIEPPALAENEAIEIERLRRIAPGAGDPGDIAETGRRRALPEVLTSRRTRGSLIVLDVDGQPVGPVVEIDPSASIEQDIRFALSPELADEFNYTDSFSMPLDDLQVVNQADGSYALQLDEDQTRYLASYLFTTTGSDQ